MTGSNVTMNQALRRAARRGYEAPEEANVDPVGDVGVGRGGGAAQGRRPDPGEAFNEWARSAYQAARFNRAGFSDLSN
jgi:hypothetical protein